MSDDTKAVSPENAEKREAVASLADGTSFRWDDVNVARLFVEESMEKCRYSREQKKWYVWDKTHWQLDLSEKIVDIAMDFSQGLYGRLEPFKLSNAALAEALRQVKRSNTNTGLRSFLELAKGRLTVTNEQLDPNPYLLNCLNGTVDLQTGKLKPHDTTDLITKVVPFNYDPAAKCPAFDKFLKVVQPNAESRKFLQHSIGYSLLGLARERVFWILYGMGNNGKSVFCDLFSEILANYASATTSSSVMASKQERIPNDIARLSGKRFIVIPETEENEKLNAALIKALSAGDKITARFLFGEFFDFYFSGKLWIATNHKPTVTDHSKGFWDRVKLIPFTVDIPRDQIIKRDILLGSMLAEASGVLAWAVRGCLEYFEADALVVPDHIKDEIALYKYEQDSIAQFIDDSCDLGPGNNVDNAALYAKYKLFCSNNGEYPRMQRRFTQNLKERGYEQRRQSSGRIWYGIGLKDLGF